MQVSIVIPNFNGEELLRRNLPSVLAAMGEAGNQIREIIVVDDGSKDASIKILKEEFPLVKVIKHTVNRGFSAAVNTGVRMSKGDLVALLNTDVAPEKNFLENVLLIFKDEKVFAVSLHEKGFGWAKGLIEDGFIVHRPAEESTTSHRTFWVNGGSGVFRRKTWMELGGMDEKLLSPLYWEDLDLSYRAQKRGYELLWEPKALVSHERESTTKKLPLRYVQRIQERNQLLFIWKNLTSQILFRKHILGLLKRVVMHPGYLFVVFSAIRFLFKVLKARNIETKEAKISDEAIFNRFK